MAKILQNVALSLAISLFLGGCSSHPSSDVRISLPTGFLDVVDSTDHNISVPVLGELTVEDRFILRNCTDQDIVFERLD